MSHPCGSPPPHRLAQRLDFVRAQLHRGLSFELGALGLEEPERATLSCSRMRVRGPRGAPVRPRPAPSPLSAASSSRADVSSTLPLLRSGQVGNLGFERRQRLPRGRADAPRCAPRSACSSSSCRVSERASPSRSAWAAAASLTPSIGRIAAWRQLESAPRGRPPAIPQAVAPRPGMLDLLVEAGTPSCASRSHRRHAPAQPAALRPGCAVASGGRDSPASALAARTLFA